MVAGRMKVALFFWVVFIAVTLALTPAAVTAGEEHAADLDVKIYYNQNEVLSSVAPILVDGRVLISLRPFLEALGSQVHWDPESNQVVIQHEEQTININLDDSYAEIDGVRREMSPPIQVINGSTMVSLRFLVECLDLSVFWDGGARTVEITSKNFVPYTRHFLSDSEVIPQVVETWVVSRKDEPGVDIQVFDRKLYILATFGLKESGGYDVRIRNLEREQDGFLVVILYIEPSPGQFTFPAFTRPFDLVSVDLNEQSLPSQLFFKYQGYENEDYPALPTRLEP